MIALGLVLTFAATVLSKDLYHARNMTGMPPRSGGEGLVANCFERELNQGGETLRIIDYTSDLGPFRWDNRIRSICVTGIWIVYSDANYNTANPGATNMWAFGNEHCLNVPAGFENKASSMRYTGVPDAWTSSSINFYYHEYFIGGEEYSYVDYPQLSYNDNTKSIIITGCEPWTVYADRNYLGNCKCLVPASTTKCTPGFYSTESSLGYMARSISSARKGCYCAKTALPDNHGVKDDVNGAHGFFPARNL